MLSLKASLDSSTDRLTGESIKDRVCCLEYFDHALLSKSEIISHDSFEIWVGEATDPYGAETSREKRLLKTRRCQDFDAIRICLFVSERGPCVTVCRTAAGTSPLYVSMEASSVCISWRFEEAVSNIAQPKANIELCRLVLKHGKGQTRAQIIEGVYALWAGEQVSFNNNGVRFLDCEEINVWLPSSFSDRARASDAFQQVTSSVIEPLLKRAKRPLLEFSGGMDSTCVALAASSVRTDLNSFGLIHPGGVGRQQRTRRQELIELLGLEDYTASSSSFSLIQSLQLEECQVTPNDEVYRVCMLNALREHALDDVDLVLSGLGGDELTKAETYGRWDWEVPGHVCASSIGGAMSHSDMYMRNGIWLLSPLCHPRVVNLCRAMPMEMRTNRLLHRLTMARAGLSDGYIVPGLHETFANVLLLEAVESDFEPLFRESILGDLGLLDVSKLLAKIYRSSELGMSVRLVGKVYNTIKLETLLRRYLS